MFVFYLLTALTLPGSTEASSMNLTEAFELAKQSRSTVLNAELEVDVSRYQRNEALSKVLPSASLFSESRWQESGTTSSGRNFGESYQHSLGLDGEMELLSRDGTLFAIPIASRLRKKRRAERDLALIELYREVSTSFYELLLIQKTLNNLRDQENLLKERVALLKQRAQIGQSKRTEAISAQSEDARIVAEKLRRELELARAEKRFLALIGTKATPQLRDGLELAKLEIPPETELTNSPEIRTALLEMKIADSEKTRTLAGFLPELNLNGRYYIDKTGSANPSDWEFGLNASWEFFSAGEDIAKRRSAELRHRQAQNSYSNLLREKQRAYEAERQTFEMLSKTLTALNQSLQLAEQNYQAHQEEFKNGLVSNLDVLQALDTYLEALQSRDSVTYEIKQTWIELQLLAGRIP
jgi:outer membrane protein